MLSAVAIADLILSRPAWVDRQLSYAERAVAIAPVAASFASEARSRRQLAILLTIGRHESRFAILVVRGGDCSLMPRGQRCDDGEARGFGQLHAGACPAAYAYPAGSAESIRAETRCVLDLFARHEARCGSLAGAFAAFATGGLCTWRGAAERVETFRRVSDELVRAERRE
jgi:hypothetical protein